MCVYITESVCFTPETNTIFTILKTNYLSDLKMSFPPLCESQYEPVSKKASPANLGSLQANYLSD